MSDPSRNSPPARWRWLLPAAVLTLLVHVSPVALDLDRALFDFASRHPLRDPPLPVDSALVLVDEHAMDALGRQGVRWPFPRRYFAALFLALHQAGARTVAGDFTFFEETDDDYILGPVAASLPNVILARTRERPPVFWADDFVAAHPALFARPRAGLVEFPDDGDGVARRYDAGNTLAALAAAAAPAGTGVLVRWHGRLGQIRAKGVPVLSATPYFAAGTSILERVAAAAPDFTPEQLAGAIAAEPPLDGPLADAVRGRVVFVGANASGTFDLKPFPVGGLEPGVLLHWTAWTNLETGGFIRALPRWTALLAAGFAFATLLAAGRGCSGLAVLVGAALGLGAAFVLGSYAGLSAGWHAPPATAIVATGLGLLGVVAERFWAEQARKREIQSMFGAYVDPAVVDRLVHDPASIPLRGERREATVFFSDLVGFTELSEKLPPEQMVEVVNAYLEETSECLHRHGAYVDKYIGDAVMAAFGVPRALPDHALAACRAALEAQQAIVAINARYAATGVKLAVRIGLNTGELIVGTLGSSRKKNYTVMGDTVNLASRLEGANKHFGTGILLGPETARRVANQLAVRPLARLRVKGKQQAVEVFTLHGEAGRLPADEQEFLDHYRAGYAAFVERRFAEAEAALARAERLRPDDHSTLYLLAESRQFARTPPPPDWEPVITLDSK